MARLRERPADEQVLRVVSDALLERGDPWGEFIRLSLDLERAWPGEDTFITLRRRVGRLKLRHGLAWQRRLQPRAGPRYGVDFFRGVPSAIGADQGKLEVLLEGPVARLELFRADDTGVVLRWPRRAGLVSLRLSPSFTARSDELLAGLEGLTELSLPWQGDATLALLERAPCRAQLERLRLFSREPVPVTPPQLERLFAAGLSRLRHLTLDSLEVGQPGAELLAKMPWRLERLELAGANLGVKGTAALVGSEPMSSVRWLVLARNAMGPKGAEALATSKALSKLVALDLSSTASAAKSLAPFFSNLALPSLRSLRLASCQLRVDGAKAIAAGTAKQLGGVTTLELDGALLGDAGVAALAKAKGLTGLRKLSLANNSIKGPGLGALAGSRVLASIEDLDLSHNKFQNAGAKALASSKYLGRLVSLGLGHNWLGVQGLKALLDNPTLTRLEEVVEGVNNYAMQLPRSFVEQPDSPLRVLRFGPESTTGALESLAAARRVGRLEHLSFHCSAFDDELAKAFARALASAGTTVTVDRVWCDRLTDRGLIALRQALGDRFNVAEW